MHTGIPSPASVCKSFDHVFIVRVLSPRRRSPVSRKFNICVREISRRFADRLDEDYVENLAVRAAEKRHSLHASIPYDVRIWRASQKCSTVLTRWRRRYSHIRHVTTNHTWTIVNHDRGQRDFRLYCCSQTWAILLCIKHYHRDSHEIAGLRSAGRDHSSVPLQLGLTPKHDTGEAKILASIGDSDRHRCTWSRRAREKKNGQKKQRDGEEIDRSDGIRRPLVRSQRWPHSRRLAPQARRTESGKHGRESISHKIQHLGISRSPYLRCASLADRFYLFEKAYLCFNGGGGGAKREKEQERISTVLSFPQ